jgi:hypothetical protein
LPPEDFQKLKGYIAEKIIKRDPTDGSIRFRSSLNSIEKNKELINAVYQPEEIAELGEVLQLGDRVGDFVFNTSNTNTSNRFGVKNFLSELVGSAYDEVSLERLKDIARGKVSPQASSPATKSSNGAGFKAGASGLRQIPLIESKSRKVIEGGRLSSIQDRNKEAERRKRAISGGR